MQISMGAPFLIKLSKKDLEGINFNPVEIAKKEFKEGIIPITVRRPYPISEAFEKAKEKEAS